MLGRCLLISTVLPVALAAQGTVQIEFVAPRDSMVATFGAANVQGGYAPGYRGIIIGAGSRHRAPAPGSDFRLAPAREWDAPGDRHAPGRRRTRACRHSLPAGQR